MIILIMIEKSTRSCSAAGNNTNKIGDSADKPSDKKNSNPVAGESKGPHKHTIFN